MRSVCVIGAGLAGLAAADALAQAGIDVTVLEERDRVGGRVWSLPAEGGGVIEMGAEFVTEGYTVVPELVARLGLTLAPMGMSFSRREPRGGIGVDGPDLDASLLAALDLHPGARELIACRIQVSYAHETSRLAAGAVRDVSWA